jgi:hypothetical protein
MLPESRLRSLERQNRGFETPHDARGRSRGSDRPLPGRSGDARTRTPLPLARNLREPGSGDAVKRGVSGCERSRRKQA